MLIWDEAITTCQDLTNDESDKSLTFFKRMMNLGYKYILADLGRSVTEKTKTASTVANQQYYQVSPDFLWFKDITITVGSTKHTITEVESQERWNQLNANSQTSTIPSFYFVRPYFGVGGAEVGFYPIPSVADNTLTLVYEAGDKDLAVDAYTAETVTMVNGDDDVVGSSTVWTAAMVGRYFTITTVGGDGMWYRIASRSANTAIKLENYYDGVSGSGLSYKIAEAFSLPEEIQILPCYFALGFYYHMKENDTKALMYLGNGSPEDRSLFTTGIREARKRYSSKSRRSIIKKIGFNSLAYPSHFPSSIT